jgi:hypothetical protein
MLWAALMHLMGFVVDLVVAARRTEDAKDVEIALLRHQLRLLLRRSPHPPRLSRWEKLTFAVLAAKLGRAGADARGLCWPVCSSGAISWHSVGMSARIWARMD